MCIFFLAGTLAFNTFSKEPVICKDLRSSALEVQEWYELGFKDDGLSSSSVT